ncbi:patatin-like phospholipase family protein [Marinilongibacter aquaticus]|uniref:patatin-like phospholipase family protein n=1 Tax=Marinilongibacter aquaticus TaxID=2975157 RepID=UPI0021BD2B7D|nr:patatin-like phospholipase family protein [Marinilongibacter aquaticus]UBM60863.1 patatin-like phospholipase family protein [Marinilongibacter aquaticus]
MTKRFSSLLCLGLLLFALPCLSQQNLPQFRNLVMEGGGTKGIAYGGALMELEEKGMLKSVIRVAGTSAGAIQASLLAIGYSAKEIAAILNQTPVESFNDGGFVASNAHRLFHQYGWFQGETFLETLENVIANRLGNRNLTFAQLHELAKSYPFRDLYVVAADLTVQQSVVFSYETHPQMRIADAVRISMSIPLYYEAVWANKEGKVFEKPKPSDNCHLYVDGGILMNYPIGLFDHSKYIEGREDEKQKVFNTETLGFRLDRPEQIDQEIENGLGIAPYEIEDFNSYMSALTSILMRNVNKIEKEDIRRTIYINDLGMSSRVRKVTEEEKQQMMESGRRGVSQFLMREIMDK